MFHELFYMYFFLFTSAIKADQPAIPYMKLELTDTRDTVTCDQSKDKNYSIIAFEGEPLYISIKSKHWMDFVECYDEKNKDTLLLSNRDIVSIDTYYQQTVEVKVTKIMGCDWICHLNFDYLFELNDVYCYIKVHVRLTNAPHKVRVNYVLMKPTREPVNTRNVDHYVEYKYKNGDEVDILCYKNDFNYIHNECTIVMKYHYDGLKDNILEINSSDVVQSNIKLHLKHNGSFIDCIYICESDYQVQRMKFVVRNDFNNDIKLFINEQEAKIYTDKFVTNKSGMNRIYVPYHVFTNEDFYIECGEDEEYYNCDSNCTINILSRKCTSWVKRAITDDCIFNCRNTLNNLNIQLKIQVDNVPKKLVSRHLSLNLTDNNTIMNFLSEKEHVMYYEFDESNEISISCIRTEMPGLKTYISTTKKLKADTKTNVQNDTLEMSHHGVYTCALYKLSEEKPGSETLYKITVVFVKKIIDKIKITTSDSFDTTDTTEVAVMDSSVINSPDTTDTTEVAVMDSSVINTPGVNYTTICFSVLAVPLLIAVAYISYRCFRKSKSNENQSIDSLTAINQDSQLEQVEQRNLSVINKEICNEHQYATASDRNISKCTYIPNHDYDKVIYNSNQYDYVDTANNPHHYDYVSPNYDPKAQVPMLKIKEEDNAHVHN